MSDSQLRSWWTLPILLATSSQVIANGFDCKDILADKHVFNLSPLGGVKLVHLQEITPPTVHNTTFAIDICKELPLNKEIEGKDDQCRQGARVCGQKETWEKGERTGLDQILNIAGEFAHHGLHLDPKPELLKGSSSHKDAEREGLRITFSGGKVPFDSRSGIKQKAIIEFVCNKTVSGNEGFEDTSKRTLKARDDGDDDGEEGDDPIYDLPHPDAGHSIRFESYKMEDDEQVLRVTWNTKYACYDAVDTEPAEPEKPSSGGWGFFTWFIIIIFLLAAAYIIFGSWLNYNRYGARGWDLIPHGDAIRDLPYILKDFFAGITDRLRGGGSRGGYSAV